MIPHATLSDTHRFAQTKALANAISSLTDDELTWHAVRLRTNETPSPIATTHAIAFAIEAIRRRLGFTIYDVQLEAALVMAGGKIAEMHTGEGKTITGAVAAIIHAIQNRQVHVATSNDYLALRDWQLLCPIFELLAITSGHSSPDQSPTEKRDAYQCDIVFATGYQFGFDYLRDQITLARQPRKRLGQSLRDSLHGETTTDIGLCQTRHQVALIDEIDSVLIDEAMTPLVLAGPRQPETHAPTVDLVKDSEMEGSLTRSNTNVFDAAHACLSNLDPTTDYVIDKIQQTTQLTENGTLRAYQWLKDHQLALSMPWSAYLQTAMRAKHLLVRDIDYVVRDGEVQIVDSSTGRIVPDRQWRDGLHQAVETKENVERSEARQTHARMSRQRYFARYETLCGMTGTAAGHDREWKSTYGLTVQGIPTRRPTRRRIEPTLYFATSAQKLDHLALEISAFHNGGNPILIGTKNILQTKQISKVLMKAGLNHRILNGVQDETEADLIATAGRASSITVATNMAGRGTDISIDEEAIAAGGLHVIGIERNLSARIDRQLLGRAARQGQPGSGRFYVSAEDELICRYDSSLQSTLSRLETPTENLGWDRRVAQLQSIAEQERYAVRQRIAQQEESLDELRKYVA